MRVTRTQTLEAAGRLKPELAKYWPNQIGTLDLIDAAANYCFVHNKTGTDVEIVRQGLKQLEEDGYLTDDKAS